MSVPQVGFFWALLYALIGSRGTLRAVEAGSRTLRVPGEYADVQSALSAAQDGDTVLVAPGEYVSTEPLTFEGKRLRLISEAGAEETTLRISPLPPDGPFEKPPPQRASVIIFENCEPPGTLVKGFEITGGLGTNAYSICGLDIRYSDPIGGGVSIAKGARVTIEECRIHRNQSNGGGGVSCQGGSVILTDCNVFDNSAWLSNPGDGGGVSCTDGADARLERCTVGGNYAQIGSGLSVGFGSRVTAKSCQIGNNAVNENGAGAGISCYQSELILESCICLANCSRSSCSVAGAMDILGASHVEMRNCRIEGSPADDYAGGMSVRGGSFVRLQGSRVTNNHSGESGGIDCRNSYIVLESSILEGNWARGGGAGGLRLERSVAELRDCLIRKNGYGGVQVLGNSTLLVVNCTIADNCETGLVCWNHTEVTVHNCILWRNGYALCGGGADLARTRDAFVSVTHSIVGGQEVWSGEGNFNSDPLFIGPSVDQPDYHLQPGSPAIDGGTASGVLDHDIEGKPRPCGAGVDMGAYEFGGCEPKRFRRGDVDGSGTIELTDAASILGYLYLGEREPECLDAADVEDDGQVSITDPIYLLGSLFLGGPSPAAPGGSCGADPTPDEVLCQQDAGCRG